MNTRKSFGKARHYLMIFLILAMTVGSVPIQAQDDNGSSTDIFLPIVQRAGDDTNNPEGGEVQAAIYHGVDSDDVSWIAANSRPDSIAGCSASLIHPEWILTAQHCDSAFATFPEITVGEADLSNSSRFTSTVDYTVKFPQWEDYKSEEAYISDLDDDVMLIHLEDVAPFSPVALDGATSGVSIDLSSMFTGTVFGWGKIETGSLPSIAQTTSFREIDADTDTVTISIPGQTEEFTRTFSAQVPSDGRGVCFGDSGGPLVITNTNGITVQVGISLDVIDDDGDSGGGSAYSIEDCGDPGDRMIFARVRDFADWIKHHISREAGDTATTSLTYNNQFSTSGPSFYPAVSEDGQYIAFYSVANNMVSGVNPNGKYQIYLRDADPTSGGVILVSRTSAPGSPGTPVNHNSTHPSISADGRYIAYQSDATNILFNNGDSNGFRDVFVFDTQLVTTTLVSVADNDTTQGNSPSSSPSISADGRYVVFSSNATNLVPNLTDMNGKTDIFIRDLVSKTTQLVSWNLSNTATGNGASSNPSISPDGMFIAFQSDSGDLTYSDSNQRTDIFVRNWAEGETNKVSLTEVGTEANGHSYNPSISENGSFVVFSSEATNIVINSGDTNARSDVFVRDTVEDTTIRVSNKHDGSQSNGHSTKPSISDDGRYIAFNSEAKLTPDDVNGGVGAPYTDVYVYDTVSGIISLASVDSEEAGGNALSAMEVGSMSGDGCKVAFVTNATNLNQYDNNNKTDIYVRSFTCSKPLNEVP